MVATLNKYKRRNRNRKRTIIAVKFYRYRCLFYLLTITLSLFLYKINWKHASYVFFKINCETQRAIITGLLVTKVTSSASYYGFLNTYFPNHLHAYLFITLLQLSVSTYHSLLCVSYLRKYYYGFASSRYVRCETTLASKSDDLDYL